MWQSEREWKLMRSCLCVICRLHVFVWERDSICLNGIWILFVCGLRVSVDGIFLFMYIYIFLSICCFCARNRSDIAFPLFFVLVSFRYFFQIVFPASFKVKSKHSCPRLCHPCLLRTSIFKINFTLINQRLLFIILTTSFCSLLHFLNFVFIFISVWDIADFVFGSVVLILEANRIGGRCDLKLHIS